MKKSTYQTAKESLKETAKEVKQNFKTQNLG